MGTLPANDRRRSPRQWVTVPVVIRHRGVHIDGVTINLSEGGMFLFAAANLPPGTQVELEFLPPSTSETVRVVATIRRRALYLFAVEFQEDQMVYAGKHADDIDNLRL